MSLKGPSRKIDGNTRVRCKDEESAWACHETRYADGRRDKHKPSQSFTHATSFRCPSSALVYVFIPKLTFLAQSLARRFSLSEPIRKFLLSIEALRRLKKVNVPVRIMRLIRERSPQHNESFDRTGWRNGTPLAAKHILRGGN